MTPIMPMLCVLGSLSQLAGGLTLTHARSVCDGITEQDVYKLFDKTEQPPLVDCPGKECPPCNLGGVGTGLKDILTIYTPDDYPPTGRWGKCPMFSCGKGTLKLDKFIFTSSKDDALRPHQLGKLNDDPKGTVKLEPTQCSYMSLWLGKLQLEPASVGALCWDADQVLPDFVDDDSDLSVTAKLKQKVNFWFMKNQKVLNIRDEDIGDKNH